MDTALIDDFERVIQSMVGKMCWSVQVSGVGSLANLHIGEKIKREQPLLQQDFQLSMEERAYEGEYVLYLEECPWRLDGTEAVIVTWMDSSDPGGRIYERLPQLKDQTITQVEITRPALDLMIHFENGDVLRVFPDQVDADDGDNYSLVYEGQTYVVTERSTLYVE